MEFEGYNGRITVEQDALVLDRTDVRGRFGGDPGPRRIPLDDIDGAYLAPPPEPKRPGYLQLVLVDQDEEELTLAEAIRHPDVVTFTPRQQPEFERLADWLENGGELDDTDEGDEEYAEVPSASASPPAQAMAPAHPSGSVAMTKAAPVREQAPAPVPAAAPVPAGGGWPASSGPAYGEAPSRERELKPVDAVRAALTKYVVFAGRARRAEYWWFALFAVALSLAGLILDTVLFDAPIVRLLVTLALFLPGLSVAVRRLHDTGRSGWYYLIGLIPLVGGILLIVWFSKDGSPADNTYGPSPKYSGGA